MAGAGKGRDFAVAAVMKEYSIGKSGKHIPELSMGHFESRKVPSHQFPRHMTSPIMASN